MHVKSVIAAAASVVILLAVPARGHNLPRYVATCIRSDLSSDPCGPGRLEVNFKTRISPERLPRHELMPIGLMVSGTVGTKGGGYPPALREAEVVLDEGIKVDTERLAACSRRRLESLNNAPAGTCRNAIIGHGVARIGLVSSGENLKVPLTLLNGGTAAGVTRLFVHGAAATTGGDLVAAGQIRRRGQALEATWRLPRLLEGGGSLLSFRIEIKRVFAASGQRHSYLSGSCPDGELRASIPELTFVNETQTPGVASRTVLKGGLAVPCTPER
jgi:hypothetical protein